jgi:hypothetical protein
VLRVRCVSGLIGEELDPATRRQELHMKLPSEPAPRNGHLRCYSMDEARKRICKKNPRRSVPTDDWRENGKHGGVRGASNLGHSRARISQGLLRSGCQAYQAVMQGQVGTARRGTYERAQGEGGPWRLAKKASVVQYQGVVRTWTWSLGLSARPRKSRDASYP